MWTRLVINTRMKADSSPVARELKSVQAILSGCLLDSRIAPLLPPGNNIMGSGKMLRAQLALHLGQANGIPEKTRQYAAAAVEIIHGASLLHDDVIDGGLIRRSAPTFWKKHGINGSILLGDLLVFEGLNLLIEVERMDLLQELIAMSKLVCRSEVEQELILRGTPGTWEECEQIARAKTGSLFAFAAVAAASDAPGQKDALREAGFMLGTAYQLADDILDSSDNEAVSGKTLGKDRERGKTTAITATKNAPTDAASHIESVLRASTEQLNPWSELKHSWTDFLNMTLQPVIHKHVSAGNEPE